MGKNSFDLLDNYSTRSGKSLIAFPYQLVLSFLFLGVMIFLLAILGQ